MTATLLTVYFFYSSLVIFILQHYFNF